MFQISQEQYDALNRQAWKDFEVRAATYFQRHYPDEMAHVAPEQLGDFLRDAQRRSAPYGIDTEYAVVRYAHLMLLLGDDFATDPQRQEYAQVLQQTKADDNARMDYLLEQALAEVTPAEAVEQAGA
jgi:hypothetical protein